MTFLTSWEEFAKAAERLYVNDPMKVSFLMKRLNKKAQVCLLSV